MKIEFIRVIWYLTPLFLVQCTAHDSSQTASFESMGSVVYVQPAGAVEIVREVFERVDFELSEWKEESSLSNINASAGISAVGCPASVILALQQAIQVSEITAGAYDPTWACMWNLWDFENPKIPDKQEVQKLLPLVNWKQVEIVGNTVFLTNEGMMLGLGGIAKGVALNLARDALLRNGISTFMIISGGQVLVNGEARVVGIRHPDGLHKDIIATVELHDASISTSGDYEKYFEVDGVRYHHILDPRTGFPASGTRSVTVICEDAALADAFSTALFVMGTHGAMELVNRLPNVEACIIDDAGEMLLSDDFVQFISDPNGVESSTSSDLVSTSDQ